MPGNASATVMRYQARRSTGATNSRRVEELRWDDAHMSRRQRAEERRRAKRVHRALTEMAERSGRPGPPPPYPSHKVILRAYLTALGDIARGILSDPLGSLIRTLVTLKVAAVIVVLVALPILWIFGSGGSDEPDHGYTAVCKDGAVLPPPDNLCGAAHGYLDHWSK